MREIFQRIYIPQVHQLYLLKTEENLALKTTLSSQIFKSPKSRRRFKASARENATKRLHAAIWYIIDRGNFEFDLSSSQWGRNYRGAFMIFDKRIDTRRRLDLIPSFSPRKSTSTRATDGKTRIASSRRCPSACSASGLIKIFASKECSADCAYYLWQIYR